MPKKIVVQQLVVQMGAVVTTALRTVRHHVAVTDVATTTALTSVVS